MNRREKYRKETRRKEFRVTIFGSARVKKNDKVYQEVYKLGKALGEKGIDIVTGGGPGLMDAASYGHEVGRKKTGAHTIGLNIKLPHEQKINEHITLKREFRKFSKRLDNFMILSEAIIVAPGGVGTLLELMYAWQLMQVENIRDIPIILMGDMWSGLIDWLKKEPLKRKYFEKKDLNELLIAKNYNEAIKIVDKAYEDFRKRKN